MPLHLDNSPSRVVAYIQNIPNRYIPVAVLHFLFANDQLLKDPEYRALLKAAGAGVDPQAVADLEALEIAWEEQLVEIASTRKHEVWGGFVGFFKQNFKQEQEHGGRGIRRFGGGERCGGRGGQAHFLLVCEDGARYNEFVQDRLL